MYKPKRKKSKLQVFEERGELLKLKKEKNKFLQFYRANDGNGKFSRISKWRAIGGGREEEESWVATSAIP